MEYSPELPLDVARLIFEAAAWSERSTAHSLALVSKDVRQWIDPILYHTVELDTPARAFAFAASVIARNDPTFFECTVKVLTIGNLDLEPEQFPPEVAFGLTELDITLVDVLLACRGIKRCSYWAPAKLQIFRAAWKYLRPTHISLISGSKGIGWDLNPFVLRETSPFLTHLHLEFSFCIHVTYCDILGAWPDLFTKAPGLVQLQLSGDTFETLEPQSFRREIEPIVSVLPQTLTRLIVNALPIRTRTGISRIPVRLKTLQSDPRVVFILPMNHPLDAAEGLRLHEKYRDAFLTREDIHCEEFCSRYLDSVSN